MALIPFDDRDGVIWYDGQMVPWREARLHVLSHGLHYGSCVFEGERVYNGRVFKLTEHSQRLRDSARLMDFEIPYSVEQLDAATRAVVAAQKVENGYVRPVAWRGSEMMAIAAQQTKIHVVIASWVWPTYFGLEAREKGISLKTSRWVRPAPDMAPVAAKAAGLYMICTISKHEAEREGFNDSLMLDYRGQIAECTGANFFMVVNGELHTPTPDCFLDGITRRTVIDLARRRGITVVERAIWPQDLAQAQEVFITGTAAELTPVGRIDDLSFTPGAITRQLIEDYTAEVTKAA
ncbi:MAG: branched-chain amino acid aminotransferase [Alphaproteobacteria bacterium]|nr:MAG: branched-chain amino acid aminotransferase [Alphaproteobacteria bacterium]